MKIKWVLNEKNQKMKIIETEESSVNTFIKIVK